MAPVATQTPAVPELQFESVPDPLTLPHPIACPSQNEIWVGELINWRVQKLVTKKGETATK